MLAKLKTSCVDQDSILANSRKHYRQVRNLGYNEFANSIDFGDTCLS